MRERRGGQIRVMHSCLKSTSDRCAHYISDTILQDAHFVSCWTKTSANKKPQMYICIICQSGKGTSISVGVLGLCVPTRQLKLWTTKTTNVKSAPRVCFNYNRARKETITSREAPACSVQFPLVFCRPHSER